MRLQSRSREEPEINVISLVDVLLVLVLFLMMSTSFLRETEISLQLPEATTDKNIDVPREALEITVTQNGSYLVNGRELVNNERRTLRAAIETAGRRQARHAGAHPRRCHGDASSRDHGDGRGGPARLREDQHRDRDAARRLTSRRAGARRAPPPDET